ncbi:MAG: AfsR/SARP family transcriptional regulator [Actinomycetota bacterium]|nr:AfsR/SARP family transcriptional regulator [Actinomycetota bacterium]
MEPLSSRLETVPGGYRLTALPAEVDAIEARELITTGRAALERGDLASSADLLQRAAQMWDGRSLGGVANEGQIAGSIASLEELRMGAIEDLIEAQLALGHHREVSAFAEEFALAHPNRERAWAHLMLARYRCDRQADAVQAFQQVSDSLGEQGLEPSVHLRALYGRIVDQAPGVAAPTPAPLEGGCVDASSGELSGAASRAARAAHRWSDAPRRWGHCPERSERRGPTAPSACSSRANRASARPG